MTAATAHRQVTPAGGLALPGVVLLGLLAILGLQTGILPPPASLLRPAGAAAVVPPATVVVVPRPYSYRASGAFQQVGAVVAGPMVRVDAPPALEITVDLVGAADYARCVADGACKAAAPRRRGGGDVPVTGVSFDDATDYARWLSAATGETWRLPTVAEWNFAAGSRAVDTAVVVSADATNPAARWLAAYARLAAHDRQWPAAPQPRGSFGTNEFGIADLSGNVWEWTATCEGRTILSEAGDILARREACGVRILEGLHQMPMSGFVRDGRSGGCAVGVVPDNLGFRLVRERAWHAVLAEAIGRLMSIR